MYIKTNRKFIFVLSVAVVLVIATALFTTFGAFGVRDVALGIEEEDDSVLIGVGNEQSPFFIQSLDDFNVFVKGVNEGKSQEVSVGGEKKDVLYASACYTLTVDLDLDGVEMVPIGTKESPFTGQLNGNGNIIKNLTINASADGVGLFGYLGENSKIEKLGVVNGSIQAPQSTYVGGFVGCNGVVTEDGIGKGGTLSNVFFNGSVKGDSYVGGLIGINNGNVSLAYSSGTVTATAVNAYLGGIIGKNSGALTDSYTVAEVKSELNDTPNYVGGVIGARESTEKGTPSYAFFDNSFASYDGALKAIGAAGGSSTDLEYVKGISDNDINDTKLYELYPGTQTKWSRVQAYESHVAYSGPLQKVFADRYTVKTDETLKSILREAVTVRKFGVNASAEGDWGSESNPYIIGDQYQLAYLATAVNEYSETYKGEYFVLASDIKYTSTATAPIGRYYDSDAGNNRPFCGTFNGMNYTISGYELASGNESYMGIFGYIDGGTILNLTIDSDCSVSGVGYVGSLAGYADATVINVESRATVKANGNSGGIIGRVGNGSNTYKNILSSVTLKGTTNMFGVFGSCSGIPVTDNVWFVTSDAAKFKSAGGGNTLCIQDTSAGKITVSKTVGGVISFKASDIASGYSVEYRNADEVVLYKETNDYTPTDASKLPSTLYARFVKEITFATDSETHTTLPGDSFPTRYYVGQKISFAVGVKSGAYIRNIHTLDGSGKTIVTESSYAFDEGTSSVVFNTVMTEDLYKLSVETIIIAWDTSLFGESYVYSGAPVLFPIEKFSESVPDGFTVGVTYVDVKEPTDANSALDSYEYTITYYKDNICRGWRNDTFRIEPKQLSMVNDLDDPIYNYLSTTKEWDGKAAGTYTESTVDQSGVEGKCEGDDVVVVAEMSFGTSDVTESTSVTYKFSLIGNQASNYTAPSSITISGIGKITKRVVRIAFANGYEAEFAGTYKDPSLAGKAITYDGVVSGDSLQPVFTFEQIETDAPNGSVGEYRLYVDISKTVSEQIASRYTLMFQDATFDQNYVTYTVTPKKVTVDCTVSADEEDEGALKSSYVYDGKTRKINSASYTDTDGKKQTVELALTANGDAVDGFKDVVSDSSGKVTSYIVSIVGDLDANYKLELPVTEVTVEQATPAGFELKYTGKAVTNGKIKVIVEDKITGATYDYALEEESKDYGTVEGNVVTLTHVGSVTVIVCRQGSQNYKSVSESITIDIAKADKKVTISKPSDAFTYGDELKFTLLYDGSEDAPEDVEGQARILVNGESFDAEKEYGVGKYTIALAADDTGALSGVTSEDYNLIFSSDSAIEIEIIARAVTVTAKSAKSVYGEEIATIGYKVEPSANLSGAPSVDSADGAPRDAGKYNIVVGNLVEANPNYEVTFIGTAEDESIIYEISPATLTVTVASATKKYGDEDPEPEYTVSGLKYDDTADSIGLNIKKIKRFPGENVYLNADATEPARYGYSADGKITHSSANYVAEVLFVVGYLTIEPRKPQCDFADVVKLKRGTTLSDDNLPSLEFKGVDDAVLEGDVAWEESAVLDFKDVTERVYNVIFTPYDRNYASETIGITVGVEQIAVKVVFSGEDSVVYDGKSHKKDISVGFDGVIDGDDIDATIEYDDGFVDAGSYAIKVTSVGNKNYVLSGATEFKLTIECAPLKITPYDVTVVEGEKPSIDYKYEGFRGDDDEENALDELPVIVWLPTKAGTYTITPDRAEAYNYDITYGDATLKILASSITSDAEEDGQIECVFSGKFDAATVATVKESITPTKVSDAYDEVKKAYTVLGAKSIYKYYDIKYYVKDAEVTPDGEIYLTLTLPEDAGNVEDLSFLTYGRSGELIYCDDILVDGDTVKINITNASGLVIAKEVKTNTKLYIILGVAAAVVIIIIILIVHSVKKKKERRYVKYRD